MIVLLIFFMSSCYGCYFLVSLCINTLVRHSVDIALPKSYTTWHKNL